VAPLSERIEPEWAMATIAFVDIRGFTTYADSVSAHEAVDYLNRFFELLIPVVGRHNGRTNKLLGDGFLAVFDVPEEAMDAAGEMIAAAEEAGYRIGIGVNSGLVLVGTLGGGDLHELGVVGDPVNVAARVQDATRELREPLLVTGATRALLDDGAAALEPRGTLALRGKPKPVAVYAPGRVRA
jgi:adenylate cyclase